MGNPQSIVLGAAANDGNGDPLRTAMRKINADPGIASLLPGLGWANVQSYGAVGDGITNDTAAFVAALASGAQFIYVPGTVGGYVLYGDTLSVTQSCKFVGDGFDSSIMKIYGGYGIKVSVENFDIEGVQLVSYSNIGVIDPKLYDAIRYDGTLATPIYYARASDVWFRGWQTCVNGKYLNYSVFDNLRTINCTNAFRTFGLSLNNSLADSFLVSDSRGLSLELDGAYAGEGLNVNNTLIASCTTGVYAELYISLNITNSTIDLVTNVASLTNCTGGFSNNWLYSTNNTVTFEDVGSLSTRQFRLTGNYMLSVTARAVHIGLLAKAIVVVGNFVSFGTYACYIQTNAVACIFAENSCADTGANPAHIFLGGPGNLVGNNVGDAIVTRSGGNNNRSVALNNGGEILSQGFTGPPTTGTWKTGDVLWNNLPNGNPCVWICVLGGTPGFWRSLVIPSVSQMDADISFTISDTGADYPTVYFNVALASNRTCSMPTNASSWNGRKFRIVRDAAGAGTLTIQDAGANLIKVIPAATNAWADVEFAGALGVPKWILTGYGLL